VAVPMVGAVAPDFTLASTSGEPVTLSSFKGKSSVLLAFFPLAFTSTCTAELCEFRDNFDALTGYGVQVMPISVDSVPTLNEFKGKHHLRTELLSDFKRDASKAYGVLLPELFFSNRTSRRRPARSASTRTSSPRSRSSVDGRAGNAKSVKRLQRPAWGIRRTRLIPGHLKP
jgi:peroxiredoxin